jgi:hypothetical protein
MEGTKFFTPHWSRFSSNDDDDDASDAGGFADRARRHLSKAVKITIPLKRGAGEPVSRAIAMDTIAITVRAGSVW